MKRPDFVTADEGPVAVAAIVNVDTSQLAGHGYIEIHHTNGTSRATGFFALEALMIIKPDALEGKRLSWNKRVWFLHNVIAHPAMQFLALGGELCRPLSKTISDQLYRHAMWIHDSTVPVPKGFKSPSPA